MQNRQGRRIADDLNLKNLSCVKKFIVDGGYSGEKFANVMKKIYATVEVVKKSDLHKFEVTPKRCEKNFCLVAGFGKLQTSLQMSVFALLSFILKRFL